MIPSLRSAAEPVRVNHAVCFSDPKGQHKKSIEKKQTKLLGFVMPGLQPILEPGEEILVVLEGVSPFSTLEFLTTGWIITALKRCFVVVTNLRLLHTAIKPNQRLRGSFSEIRYGDVASFEVSGLLSKRLKVRYRDGKKEEFTLLRPSALKMEALLPQLSRVAPPSARPGRHFLCPTCASHLQAGVYRCGSCGQEFKDQGRARLWSLVAPGGGYFYTGHPILGIMDAFVEMVFIVVVIGGILMLRDGDPEALSMLGIGVAFLAIEKLITVYHAHHYVNEYLPVGTPASPTAGMSPR